MNMKAEIGVMQIQAKERERLWVNHQNMEGFSYRRAGPCQDLDFGFLASRTGR